MLPGRRPHRKYVCRLCNAKFHQKSLTLAGRRIRTGMKYCDRCSHPRARQLRQQARFTPIIDTLLRGPSHLMELSRRSGIGRESVRRRLRVLIEQGKVERFVPQGMVRTEYRMVIPDDVQSPDFETWTDTLGRYELAVVALVLDATWTDCSDLVGGFRPEHKEIVAEIRSNLPALKADAARCRHADRIRDQAFALLCG